MKPKLGEIEVGRKPKELTKIFLDSVEKIDRMVKKEGTGDAE